MSQRGRPPGRSTPDVHIVELMVQAGHLTTTRVSGRVGVSVSTARRMLKDLVAKGWATRRGPTGHYYVPTELGATVAASPPPEPEPEPKRPRLPDPVDLSPLPPVPENIRQARTKQGKAFRRCEEGWTWHDIARAEGFASAGDAERAARMYASRVRMPWPPYRYGGKA